MPFNIFHFLNLERREDVLHTPMIAGLLNLEEPEMGKLFLEEFFKGLRQKEPEIPPTPELLKGTWRVETEKIVGTTEKGYIDILMTSSQLNCAIIIENKVDASEGHLQVHKYAEWGRQHYGQYWIFLLSPEGREATSVAGEKCVPISYALIRDWLARCVGRVKDPQMKYMVECYLEVVSGLVPIKPVVSTQTMENKLIPPKQYTDTTLQFLATLTNYLNRKPELQNLAFVLDEDTYFRKYHAVIAIHKPFQQMSEKKLLLDHSFTGRNQQIGGDEIFLLDDIPQSQSLDVSRVDEDEGASKKVHLYFRLRRSQLENPRSITDEY